MARVTDTPTEQPTEVYAVVYAKPAQGQQRGRSLFEGLIEDAEAFIANNFPRLHSAEVGPDFTVETDPAGQAVKLPKGYDEVSTQADEATTGDPAA